MSNINNNTIINNINDCEIETTSDLKSFSVQFPLLLAHRITSADLTIQSTHKQPFSIAWYGEPFIHNNEQYIRTLKTFPTRVITIEPLKDQMKRYSDLKQRLYQRSNELHIKNSDVNELAQWFQCSKCQKWRVNRIEKQYFPQVLQPNNWQCNMGQLSVNNCNIPQTQPSPHEFSQIDLNALQYQRDVRAQESPDWYKMAHAILDGMIRKFDTYLLPFMHPIFCPIYYKSTENAMSITKLKYMLENQKITGIAKFINELIKMWESVMRYYTQRDPVYQRAVFLYKYCMDVISKLEIPPQTKQMILDQIKIRFEQHASNIETNDSPNVANNNTILNTATVTHSTEPLIRITTQHQVLINQPLPPLEKESGVIEIMTDSDDNCNINNTIEDDTLSISIDGNDENDENINDNVDTNNTVENMQEDDVSSISIDGNDAMDELKELLTNNTLRMDVDDVDMSLQQEQVMQYRNLCNSYTNDKPAPAEKASSLPLRSSNKSPAPAPDQCLTVETPNNATRKTKKYRRKKQIKSPLRKLNLRFCAKPTDILCVDIFEDVLVSTAGITDKIKTIIEQIRIFDPDQCFFKEVQHEEYSKIVPNPIHFGQIIDKLEQGKYNIIADVLADFTLLWSNCYVFNGEPDPNNEEFSGFSNFASELQYSLNEYMKQLSHQLAIKGYVKDNTLNEIGRICHKLGLGAITTNRIYYFENKVEMYKNIESHFVSFDVEQFKEFISAKNSHYCRDMKNGMNVKGPIIPTKVLKRTIIERFEQLKQSNINDITLARRIRRRRTNKRQVLKVKANVLNKDSNSNSNSNSNSASNTNTNSNSVETSESTSPFNLSRHSSSTNKKRSYIISDSDTDHSAQETEGTEETEETADTDQISINRPKVTEETRQVMTQLHEYPMKGPFRCNEAWCCDNAQCIHTQVGIFKNYDMKYWVSTQLGDKFYLCDGCVKISNYPLTLGKIRYFTDKDGDKIRLGLDCPYIGCDAPLQLLYGIHDNCLGNKTMVRCNHCKNIISNKNLLYYHCIDGCLNYKTIHGHQYYLCAICAETYCYSPQKYVPITSIISSDVAANMLSFYGVWTCFDGTNNECEIMIMLQDSNRISFQFCGGNERFDANIQENIDESFANNKILIEIDHDNKGMTSNSMNFKHAIWQYYSDSDIRLEFINKSIKNKIFRKVLPKCNNCECNMLFLYQNTFPNNSCCQDVMKCCDNFEEYDFMKYATIKAINYGIFHDNINKNKFYFYCRQCNKYSICAGCSLIKHEIQMNKTNITGNIITKKKKEIKRKANDNDNDSIMTDNNNKMSEKEVKILRDKIRAIETDRDFWKQRYRLLSKAMQNTLHSMNK